MHLSLLIFFNQSGTINQLKSQLMFFNYQPLDPIMYGYHLQYVFNSSISYVYSVIVDEVIAKCLASISLYHCFSFLLMNVYYFFLQSYTIYLYFIATVVDDWEYIAHKFICFNWLSSKGILR